MSGTTASTAVAPQVRGPTIVLISHDLGAGGVQRKIADFARCLATRCEPFDGTVYVLLAEGPPADPGERAFFDAVQGSTVRIRCRPKRLAGVLGVPFPLFCFWWVFRLRPQRIIGFLRGPGLIAVMLGRLFWWRDMRVGISDDSYPSGAIIEQARNRTHAAFMRALVRVGYAGADWVAAPSEAARMDLIETFALPPERITVSRNWVMGNTLAHRFEELRSDRDDGGSTARQSDESIPTREAPDAAVQPGDPARPLRPGDPARPLRPGDPGRTVPSGDPVRAATAASETLKPAFGGIASPAARAASVPDDGFDLIYVGRLAPVKNLSLLVEILRDLREIRPSARAVIVGGGPGLADLERQRARLGLANHLVLPGWQQDVTPWLRASQLFCLTSHHEGLPIAALEAMSLGLPVISTRYPGAEELVQDGETGFLCRNGNEFVDRVVLCLTRDSLRSEIGQRARAWVAAQHGPDDLRRFVRLIVRD